MIDERSFLRLAEVASATGASARFSKILTDASLPPTAKIKLLNDVTNNALGESGELVDLLKTTFGEVTAEPLPQRLLSVTAGAGFDLAEQRLPAVEEGLRAFADLVDANAELRFAMTDPGATDAAKKAIVRDLLNGKVDNIAITLLTTAVSIGHGADIANEARALADLAAKRQGHVVADVRTAIELDDNYKSRIASALSSAVGTKVEPRFVVDPTIVGSVVVRVGDEVWDGSVRQRLEQARLALTGASS
jgi:F-type H+-transporting ATPase subunit delta